jgi:hypothetical protein
MQAEDAELERFRRGVNCAALLEGWSPAWRLDRRESTRRALKYRREEGGNALFTVAENARLGLVGLLARRGAAIATLFSKRIAVLLHLSIDRSPLNR